MAKTAVIWCFYFVELPVSGVHGVRGASLTARSWSGSPSRQRGAAATARLSLFLWFSPLASQRFEQFGHWISTADHLFSHVRMENTHLHLSRAPQTRICQWWSLCQVYCVEAGTFSPSSSNKWTMAFFFLPVLIALMQHSCSPRLKSVSVPSSTNSPWGDRRTIKSRIKFPWLNRQSLNISVWRFLPSSPFSARCTKHPLCLFLSEKKNQQEQPVSDLRPTLNKIWFSVRPQQVPPPPNSPRTTLQSCPSTLRSQVLVVWARSWVNLCRLLPSTSSEYS